MILADTSVWVDHLRRGNEELRDLLGEGEIVCHPFVFGELACGFLRRRDEVLTLLRALPAAVVAEHEEVLRLVEDTHLQTRGLGWVDGHLLAAARLSRCKLWTLDRPLRSAAESMRVGR